MRAGRPGEVNWLVLLEEKEGKAVEAGASGGEGGEVGTRLLSFSHPAARNVGAGGRKSIC